jgi:hypothetical protein
MAAYVGSKNDALVKLVLSSSLSPAHRQGQSIGGLVLYFSLASKRQETTLLFLLSMELSLDHLPRSLLIVPSSPVKQANGFEYCFFGIMTAGDFGFV